jgi:hypothetical protein
MRYKTLTSALLRRSRITSACLKVSADEGERQYGCAPGVPLSDGARARKAGSDVKRITRQCCRGPATDIPHIVRPCCGNGAQAQDKVPDADCSHEQQIGTGRLLPAGQPHRRSRRHNERDTDCTSEPADRLAACHRHDRSVVHARPPAPGRCARSGRSARRSAARPAYPRAAAKACAASDARAS